jgi:lipopolysaccharide biosynthesis glycosyltransferase
MGEPIHIALTFDDGFWAPAYAVMRSACLASRRRADLVFHLVYKGLSPEHRQRLGAITDEFGATLRDYPLDSNADFQELSRGFVFRYRFNEMILARLGFDRILPPDLRRVIYLDCDVMVHAPIEDLWATDLNGLALGGVEDPHRHLVMLGREFRGKADLFDFHQPYLNSGVLLIDMARWRAADLIGRVENFREQGLLTRLYYDQDIINLVFAGNWLALDWRWNAGNPRQAHEMLEPFILHYSGDRKPWNLVSGTAFSNLYRHVMTNAVYYDFMKERTRRRLLKPLKRLPGQTSR